MTSRCAGKAVSVDFHIQRKRLAMKTIYGPPVTEVPFVFCLNVEEHDTILGLSMFVKALDDSCKIPYGRNGFAGS